ncbi:substrate-binding periplasmic protein [Kordiimonas lacus]|uniref:ABC-type amino acid transport substrate-binding protein n=1 Tax=Kordiimonas lacus TaxID=637679 RepID=A0A1G6YKA1_9PROT|nr:transporter substrate-binding domain-containing protein [Kordiimonas lacus]SDD90819.1 ABC-type amino acid transport substrate-binding protein [Kordiimonas lacus]
MKRAVSGRPFKVCLAAMCLFFSVGHKAAADDTLRLYYLALPGLLEGENGANHGPLAKVIREVSKRADVEFQLQYMVMNRMIRELQTEEAAAGVPQLGAMIKFRYERPVQLSLPIVFRRDYAFVRTNTTIPHTLNEIRKMVLVISPMTTLPPPLNVIRDELAILETHSDASALTLLSKGRADVWINDETTTRAGILEADVDNIKYDANRPFYVWPAHMVFSKSVSPALIKRIDAAILSMVRDGTMDRALPKNFVSNYNAYLPKPKGN